jgi:DNA-binding Lrp family transcriptional regulator
LAAQAPPAPGAFAAFRVFLSDAKGAMSYADAAAKTGLSEAAARQAVRRLRQR